MFDRFVRVRLDFSWVEKPTNYGGLVHLRSTAFHRIGSVTKSLIVRMNQMKCSASKKMFFTQVSIAIVLLWDEMSCIKEGFFFVRDRINNSMADYNATWGGRLCVSRGKLCYWISFEHFWLEGWNFLWSQSMIKADRYKSRAPRQQRPTDRLTDWQSGL